MKTTKIVKSLLNVKSATAGRIIRKEWDKAYLEMNAWWSELQQLFSNWADWNGIELPNGYLPEGGVNPEWRRLMDQYIEEEGAFSPEQEAYVLGFWAREAGLQPKWEGDETRMMRWMLGIR